MVTQLQAKLRKRASRAKRKILQSFFKCSHGEYGEGDQFLGVTVPEIRSLVAYGVDLSFSDIKKLITSRFHEERLLALLILVERFEKANEAERKVIFSFYLRNRSAVNNWDLVDSSAHKIVGAYLQRRSKKVLSQLARSNNLWDRRIAVISTWHFIRQGDLKTTFYLCEKLLQDKEDLMHKACGWMLREAGKSNEQALETFLKKNVLRMPRTMLRYAIEKFSESKRKNYLQIRQDA